MEKVILQGRVAQIYDPLDLGNKRMLQGFTLLTEVNLLDDNDKVQTEVYTFMANAFDDVARQVNAKLRLNDEVLVIGTTTDNEEQASTATKNQIIIEQFRILPK